jgi:hypothetical protein
MNFSGTKASGNPPKSPFVKGGQLRADKFPLFEKEGPGEI